MTLKHQSMNTFNKSQIFIIRHWILLVLSIFIFKNNVILIINNEKQGISEQRGLQTPLMSGSSSSVHVMAFPLIGSLVIRPTHKVGNNKQYQEYGYFQKNKIKRYTNYHNHKTHHVHHNNILYYSLGLQSSQSNNLSKNQTLPATVVKDTKQPFQNFQDERTDVQGSDEPIITSYDDLLTTPSTFNRKTNHLDGNSLQNLYDDYFTTAGNNSDNKDEHNNHDKVSKTSSITNKKNNKSNPNINDKSSFSPAKGDDNEWGKGFKYWGDIIKSPFKKDSSSKKNIGHKNYNQDSSTIQHTDNHTHDSKSSSIHLNQDGKENQSISGSNKSNSKSNGSKSFTTKATNNEERKNNTDTLKRNDSNNNNDDNDKSLTIADLERVLSSYGYVKRDEIDSLTKESISKAVTNQQQQQQNQVPSKYIYSNYGASPNYSNDIVSSTTQTSTPPSTSTSKVAFPQPSILSYRDVRIGSSVSSGFLFFLLSISIKPNLWLAGIIIGSFIGYDIAEKNEKNTLNEDGTMPSPPFGLYGDVVLKSGRKLAKTYLLVHDFVQGVWFMYKTGQLSYEYYKTYAKLDSRFGIQDKLDAWNARFVQGKLDFDRWEQENEVGRKVLAGLRTVWLLEEKSYKNQYRIKGGRKQSKYRLVQIIIDVTNWFKRFTHAMWNAFTGGGDSELRDIMRGLRAEMSDVNVEFVAQRFGAAVAAIVAVNLVGAMFAVAPIFLGILAVLSGIIWPDWVGGMITVLKEAMREIKERGRKGKGSMSQNKMGSTTPSLVDRNDFYFYTRKDGTKRWYRCGKSIFSEVKEQESENWLSKLWFAKK